jgi:predicted metal-dependent enzyme (double-stranded beta helix superfamily)
MDAAPQILSLDDFIVRMSREPASSLPHARFMDLASRLSLSAALLAGHMRFSSETYARNLVCRTPFFELLVLCWRPGQQTTIHDHAGALNAIHVHSGVLTSRVFTRVPGTAPASGPVRQAAEARVRPDDPVVGVDRDGIHQLANTSTDELVTIHVYAPALMELTVYSTESAEVQRRPLRYALEEDLA